MSRRRWAIGLVVTVAAGAMGYALLPADAAETPATRSALSWPFAQNSIWNMPIGSKAVYKDANLQPATALGPTTEEDLLILRPDAPRQDVVEHDAGWDGSRKRCNSVVSPTKVVMPDMPIPTDFVTDPGYLGNTPNQSTAILSKDGRTVRETQPFHRCSAGGPAISQYTFGEQDIMTGDGIRGAHGGSGMSALGGTIRAGEMKPGSVLRHALKITMWGKENFHCGANEPDGKAGYRWPALQADGGACDKNSFASYGAGDAGVQMGTLLALPPSFDVSSLRSEAARIMAKAMQDYGMYIVDNIGWDAVGLAMEWGPDGRVRDEMVSQFGVNMDADRANPPNEATADFIKDFDQLLDAMNYVDNNGPDSIGGGGTPRAALAPPFGSAEAATSTTAAPTTAPTTTAPTTAAPTSSGPTSLPTSEPTVPPTSSTPTGAPTTSAPPTGGGASTGALVGNGDKCLDVDTAATTRRDRKVRLWSCDGTADQRWTRATTGRLTAAGGCLTVAGGGRVNGNKVAVSRCTGAAAQKWELRADGTIRNPRSGRCLDAKDLGAVDGTPVQVWDCHGGANQRWRLVA